MDYAIGSKKWPGLTKLIEEAGEVLQVVGKYALFCEWHAEGEQPKPKAAKGRP